MIKEFDNVLNNKNTFWCIRMKKGTNYNTIQYVRYNLLKNHLNNHFLCDKME